MKACVSYGHGGYRTCTSPSTHFKHACICVGKLNNFIVSEKKRNLVGRGNSSANAPQEHAEHTTK